MNRIKHHIDPKKNKLIKGDARKQSTHSFYQKGGITGLKGREISLKKEAEKNKLIKNLN